MKYYCIGIKGTGMSTLAQILYDLGNEVSGYDDMRDYKYTEDGLKERNIKIYYDCDHDIDKDTIVTYSVAFKKSHREMKRVKKLGLTIKPYGEIMAEVIDKFSTVGVSGTHGKTSTCSLIKQILDDNGGCNYFIGAGDGKASLDNEYYVVESDEFNRHFLYYHPKYSIITSLEEEHMEIYEDIDDIIKTFEKFAKQTKELVIANGDNESIRKIKFKTKVIFYGFNDNNDLVIKNVKYNRKESIFDLYLDGKLLGNFKLPLFGQHMVLDATAAIGFCNYIGVPLKTISKALEKFVNAKRRFEIKETIGDTILVDDYGHHPTEIKVTLEAAHQKYPDKKIVVVFRPNTYSRIRDFCDNFVDALEVADKVYLTEVVANREKQEDYPGITTHMIGDKIKNSEFVDEETVSVLEKEKGSVVMFMGCADNSHLIENYTKLLKE